MEEPGGRRGRDDRRGGHLDLRALRRRPAGELDVHLRERGQGGADRPGGLGPGADPQQPAAPGAGRPPGATRAARLGGRGPWHPATHLELLHAAPAFTVIAVGLAFGLVAGRMG